MNIAKRSEESLGKFDRDKDSADSIFSDPSSGTLKKSEVVSSSESEDKLLKYGSAMADEGPAQWSMERQPEVIDGIL